MISALLAAAFTFTATATGVEKGTPLEFMFAAKDTDRDYETMFLVDEPVDSFLKRLESSGIPRGVPTEQRSCRLWPVGVPLKLTPGLSGFVDTELPDGLTLGELIYTGGTRLANGLVDAATNMPGAVFALYSLAQSPIVFNGIYEQGVVYGSHKAKITLPKGERRTFTLQWDETTQVHSVDLHIKKGTLRESLELLKVAAQKDEVSVRVRFSDDLTVVEATAVANALALIDSVKVKVNGRDDDEFFYRAFLPLVKWKDRRERMTQPFEVTLGSPDRIVYIDEDWSVEGDDPKLTEKPITYEQMSNYPKTDTVFFFAKKDMTVGTLRKALKRLPKSVTTQYVYWE